MKIEAYFASTETANKAVEKLKASGFKDAFVDMNEHYNENRNVQTNLPGTESSVSLSGLVLESGAHGAQRDKAPLDAASPMVSGMGRFDEIADVNCKVIVETGEGDANKIRQILRDAGGDLESPNIRKPKIDNRDELFIKKSLHDTSEFIDREL